MTDDPFAPKNRSAAAVPDLSKPPRTAVKIVEPTTDRLPPHSLEAEQGVLGCILLAPAECLAICQARLKSPDVFYDLRHRTIYQTLIAMTAKNIPIDSITLQQRLKSKNNLDSVGGLAFLSALPDNVPSAANLDYYLTIVLDHYKSRRVIEACTAAVTVSFEDETKAAGAAAKLEHELAVISNDSATEVIRPIGELAAAAVERIEYLHANQGTISGLPTGFIDLDKYTGGLEPADYVIVAGRPSMGKTSFAMNIAEHVALDQKKPVCVFSLEMTAPQLVLRMLCSRARVNLRNISEGFLRESDVVKLKRVQLELTRSKLFIDDSSDLTISSLRARARLMAREHGVALIIVDYIGILQADRRYDRRNAEVGALSAGLKSMAKELKVPVMTLCQLDRGLDKQKSQKPRMADLRESGSLEQDADKIIGLYNPKAEEEEEEQTSFLTESQPAHALIMKQRNGPSGVDVKLLFLKSITRFESAAKITMDDVPEQNVIPFSPPAAPKEPTLPYAD